uniref:Rearranged L-myc fusion n=1 Tax=Neogobius melanostomus TaxID=47308 RepID=A0A8C6S7S1_9GOBI
MHYAGSRNSMDHGLPLLEVYCLSINCFASARSHLTAESDKVALVLKRLALSCFELFLSVSELEIPYEAWLQFHQSVQLAHDMLLEYGSTDLQALLQMTGEGGAWSNPVLTSLLTGQLTDPEEVDAYISLEGDGFMEMRVKHLEKIGEVAKAVVLAKACAECSFISNKSNFRQTYVSLLCQLLPNEEAISEISRLDCKDVLEITCNLENEGEENTAFILCTTYLTQQLQQQNQYCSWDLILLWSKLQRKLDPTLQSFLDRCLQLGAIAKTVHHLLYLVRVIQTEVEDLGVAQSVELCVKALQLPKQDDLDTRISVCKTISCLLADDIELCRACLLTEFLLGPSQEVFQSLEELYLRPDQKNDLENAVIPNSLRCELLLALKSYWPFDPEFWDWKTLKHQCISLLGLQPESEEEEQQEQEDKVVAQEKCKLAERQETSEALGMQNGFNGVPKSNALNKHHSNLSEIQNPSMSKKSRFQCQVCKKFFTDAQLVFHSKRHSQSSIHPCPVCLKRFNSRKELVPHLKQHTTSAVSLNKDKVKEEPDQKHTNSSKKHVDNDEHITFDYISRHYNLQNREECTCPGTDCPKVFKHSKYLYVHLKSEHKGDENVKYFHKMKDKREKCVFCRKHFISSYHYRKHRKSHYGDQPYTCLVVGCGAQFRSSNELGLHKQTHGFQLNYQCALKGCYVTYSDLGQVYHHEAEHFRDAAFTCTAPKCSKYYLSKTAFTEHLATHNIHFTEHDFELQRKAKRKYFKSSANDASACQIRSNNSPALNGDASHGSSPLEQTDNKQAKTTLVAVCFDGSKFTCGFEKCGMTFSRARDVQRHLKCAHPEHLKTENKEHKHDRERGFKSKVVKTESNQGANKQGHKKSKVPLLHIKAKKEQKASPQVTNPDTSVLHDALTEIVIGLCKLDLNCPSSPNEPPQLFPETTPSEILIHQVIMEKPGVSVLQKEAVLAVERDSTCKSTSDREDDQESLANAKPFVCDVKSCGFRTAKGYSLQRHYTRIHRRSLEKAKKLTSHKPYICDICSKPYRDKDLLRNHYIQEHNISDSQVNQMKCGCFRYEGTKTPERRSPHAHSSKSKEAKLLKQPGTDDEQSDSEAPEKELDPVKVEQNGEQKEDSEAGATHQGRAKRLAAKSNSNLCYILDRFSKPFHCVAKNCDAAFSTQAGLVRHLQMAHHYNRSQLLLENEGNEQSAEIKKESPKKRPLPNSDEPQPQYKCQFANCHASYHLKSSLARHTREVHSHPEVIRSKYEGCTSAFNHDGEQKKHALYNNSEYYDSLVVRLQSTQKNSLNGCQKKLIVSSQSPQKEDPDSANSQNAPTHLNSGENEPSLELNQKRTERTTKTDIKTENFNPLVFKSHEEALQMCQDRCLPEAYPCMIQDCDTVVQYLSSLHRHYINVHRMRRMDFDKEGNELVLNAEQLEEMIQRKSVRSTGVTCPNGVLKMEYQTETENSGDLSAPMSLHSIKTETQVETTPDSLGFPVEEKDEEQPSVERNGVLVGADEVLYGEPSTDGHSEEPAVVTQNCQKREERLSLEQIKPFLRPVTVDLSPPSSLRFITEKGFVDLSNKDRAMIKEKLKNRRSFDIALYKPVGFESSFLNFINDRVTKDKTVTSSKRQNFSRRSCSVKENNQMGIAQSRRRTHSPLLKSRVVCGITSIQNLKLDKVLAGCGDLAIRQLQYLKPVVVLQRPVCSTTLPDHYPADTNKSKLLLGS